MPLAHQVAQKLHGLSDSGCNRAHDLVDLQLILAHGGLDFAETRRIAERLFANRRRQDWPPQVMKGDKWDTLYADARGTLDVLESVDAAIEWANALVAKIATA